MLPFLLVSTRPEDEAIEAEYRIFLTVSQLEADELQQVRLDMLGLPDIEVRDYAGIIVAGSPYGTTTPDDRKSATQKRTEAELLQIFRDVETYGVPCLTTGFGSEVAAVLRGGLVSKKWGEWSQIVDIMLTREGLEDPLLEGFPHEFATYVGHREAVEVLPEGAVVLARSLTCPYQMIRLGERFWATQFNPELDSDAIRARLQAFEDAGYPGTDDLETLVMMGRSGQGRHQAGALIRNFVRLSRSLA
ncbi:glutamine amidotransferase-related protein [Schaalia suimastitidis]|uniref:glutamine amidotransferase-related protein n=1 Tax=Schaalia suimastitidis TaxID=121163 RepID=UPI000408EFEB|nr:glutamine amidotransferase [Schaalia suimastitidis]